MPAALARWPDSMPPSPAGKHGERRFAYGSTDWKSSCARRRGRVDRALSLRWN